MRSRVTLALCGDVMTGRGVDQILRHPSRPEIHESYMKSALGYVALAERAGTRIPRKVSPSYIWGDALALLGEKKPDARIINLETALTRSESWSPKGINYRMHPDNVACLSHSGVDCCVLSNNHILDWGREGLLETRSVLARAGIASAGAGRNLAEASAPAVIATKTGVRILVFGFGHLSSGIPLDWAAKPDRPGVNLLRSLSEATVDEVKEKVRELKRPDDIVVASIHWGSNWGYEIPSEHRIFARQLIDRAGVDLVHGHSAHHVKGLEIHHGKLILYGCGDLINDYEGISGHEEFRSDLSLIYLPAIESATGRLVALDMLPFRLKSFRLGRGSSAETTWLRTLIEEESEGIQGPIRTVVEENGGFRLEVGA